MNFVTNKKLMGAVLGVLSLAYPFFIYYGSDKFPVSVLLWVVIGLMMIRSLLPLWLKKKEFGFLEKVSLALTLVVSGVMGGVYLWHDSLASLLYPVVMSLAMGGTFLATLIYPPSMIERFARLAEPNLSEAGVYYTRKATIAWVIYCFANAIVALITVVLGDLYLWTLYNGCLSYVLMGLMMAGEYLIRLYLKAKRA
jgi:uncharacterized membrane protein